jgi:hypothetical protein
LRYSARFGFGGGSSGGCSLDGCQSARNTALAQILNNGKQQPLLWCLHHHSWPEVLIVWTILGSVISWVSCLTRVAEKWEYSAQFWLNSDVTQVLQTDCVFTPDYPIWLCISIPVNLLAKADLVSLKILAGNWNISFWIHAKCLFKTLLKGRMNHHYLSK